MYVHVCMLSIRVQIKLTHISQGHPAGPHLKHNKHTQSTTGETLAIKFIARQEESGIVVANMWSQGYDGAANMAGMHRGVQARSRQQIPGGIDLHALQRTQCNFGHCTCQQRAFGEKHDGHTPTDRLLLQLLS